MEHHGSESYFVLDEGLLTKAREGRQPPPLANAAQADSVPPFRFRRVGPNGRGKQPGDPATRRIARAMTAGRGGFGNVPAGYTYLGQFVDHDLTFDKTEVTLGTHVPPAQLVQARSPSLDLDSLYGAGPGDPLSEGFYSDGVHLKLGKTDAVGPPPLQARDDFDLPRVGGSGSAAKKRKANIPDHRNDENLAVAQTHLAFIRFHNRVVDMQTRSLSDTVKFARARESVTKHYQWMLRHDYLPRIVQPSIVNDVFNNGRKVVEPNATAADVPAMPIEFSVAAFRLGHAMVRQTYDWNAAFPGDEGTLEFLFIFSGTSGNFFGGQRLPSNWIADWRRMYDLKGEQNRDDLAPPARVNRAARIDTTLAPFLHTLPTGSTGDETGGIADDLAFRNLQRAKMVRLATGQQMVAFMKRKGVNVNRLTRAQLRDGKNGAKLDDLTEAQRKALLDNTPLWFYILREAELNNGRLTGVGGRLVAETFHRAMQGSTFSIVRDPAWRPNLGPDANTFRMSDLLMVAYRGQKNQLAPLGDSLGPPI